MKLTEHFALPEMIQSASAHRKGYKEQFTPSEEIITNLRRLCEEILQPLRHYVDSPIIVGSGYRCERLNKDAGGKPNSQHLLGQAADIHMIGARNNAEIYNAVIALRLPFDQLIWEYGDDKEPAWVHVSFGPRHRRQVLKVP